MRCLSLFKSSDFYVKNNLFRFTFVKYVAKSCII